MLLAPSWLLAVLLVSTPGGAGPGRVTVAAPEVDAVQVERGLRARVGERLRGFEVDVAPDEPEGRVRVSLRRPDGSGTHRAIDLRGSTVEERSRELAAALAILVDQYEPPRPRVPSPPAAAEPPRRFFLAAGPRLGAGRPPDLDIGASLVAGLWIAREHLQPRLSGSWSASWRGGLLLHGARFGAGLAGGAALVGGRLWVGGFAVGQAVWVQARDVRAVETWVSSLELGPLFAVRTPRFVAELRTGIDLTLPPLSAHGTDARLRWGIVRYMVGLSVGPRF